MDPDEALAQIRRAYQYMQRPMAEKKVDVIIDHLNVMVDSVIALDHWLSKGGFLPHAWDPARHESINLYPCTDEPKDKP